MSLKRMSWPILSAQEIVALIFITGKFHVSRQSLILDPGRQIVLNGSQSENLGCQNNDRLISQREYTKETAQDF